MAGRQPSGLTPCYRRSPRPGNRSGRYGRRPDRQHGRLCRARTRLIGVGSARGRHGRPTPDSAEKRLTGSAISNRDYALVQGCLLSIGLTYVLVNLLTDVVYRWVNPRMRG